MMPCVTVWVRPKGADGEDPVADFSLVGVGEGEGVEVRGVDLDDCDIGFGVDADEFGRVNTFVGQRTSISSRSRTTWLLVRMWPCRSKMIPVPEPPGMRRQFLQLLVRYDFSELLA